MQWEALIQEHPDDMQIHVLYALRLGLCFEVDRGDLTVDQTTEIFENMRSALINAKTREMEEELEEGEKQGRVRGDCGNINNRKGIHYEDIKDNNADNCLRITYSMFA